MSNPDTPSTPKRRSKLLLIGIPVAVLLLGGAGGGFWYVKNVRAASTGEKKTAEEPEATGYLRFDPFTINLADPGGRRYLRIAVGLVLEDANTAKKVTEDELVMSKVRSILIDTLSGRLAADLSTPDGRAALKKAIAAAASDAGHMKVRDVLFTDFIVQ